MKIAFFSEIGRSDKFPRNFENARTDVAWAIALDAVVHHIGSQYKNIKESEYNLGIIIVPKKTPEDAFKCYKQNFRICKKWAVMQEGPHWGFQDWDVEIQFTYLNLLNNVDLILCHNEFDVRYFKGLLPHQQVEILPSLMIEDAIPKNELISKEQRNGVVIGGNFVSWYGGMDSFLIAQELNGAVHAPSMGRKQKSEDLIEGISYYPYMTWSQWMIELSKRKYAVHLMRTFAAGTFAANCAYLGIPCIGYRGLDTQEILFPELSVNMGDMESARKIAKHLNTNSLFYDHVSEYAKKAWNDNYQEEIFLSKFNSYFQ